jgi:hypothetical protein
MEGIEGEPVEHVAPAFRRPSGLAAGTWRCTPFTLRVADWPVDELMVILEGSVHVSGAGGRALRLGAGDVVLAPKGAAFTWRQTSTVRKFFVVA